MGMCAGLEQKKDTNIAKVSKFNEIYLKYYAEKSVGH